jgi:hypothetical protein
MRYFAANGANFKAIGESSQCGPMAGFPSFAEPNDSNSQFHECAVLMAAININASPQPIIAGSLREVFHFRT